MAALHLVHRLRPDQIRWWMRIKPHPPPFQPGPACRKRIRPRSGGHTTSPGRRSEPEIADALRVNAVRMCFRAAEKALSPPAPGRRGAGEHVVQLLRPRRLEQVSPARPLRSRITTYFVMPVTNNKLPNFPSISRRRWARPSRPSHSSVDIQKGPAPALGPAFHPVAAGPRLLEKLKKNSPFIRARLQRARSRRPAGSCGFGGESSIAIFGNAQHGNIPPFL